MKKLLLITIAVLCPLTATLAQQPAKPIDARLHLFQIEIETLTKEFKITLAKKYEIQRNLATTTNLTEAQETDLKQSLQRTQRYEEQLWDRLNDQIVTHNRYLEQKK